MRWEGGSNVNWDHPGILLPLEKAAIERSLCIEVLSANLTRESHTIGTCHIPLNDQYFVNSSPLNNVVSSVSVQLEV